MNLTDKTVLITGANGGLGQSFIRYCLLNNAKKIYCCVRDTTSLDKLNEQNDAIEVHVLNITDRDQVYTLAATLGAIDLLINNAGVNSGKRVFEETNDDFHVNVEGTLNVCRAFTPNINVNGAIITVTSILARINLPLMGVYSASKSALRSLTQAMRAELAPKHIYVYEVLPGPIDTKMTEGMEMEKASPDQIVGNLFKRMKENNYEIYPDGFSQMVNEALEKDPAGIEADFAHSVQG